MMNEWIISSSVLIAAVLLGRRLLRGRISLRLQYALWAVVLVRLLLPVQLFTSDYSTGSIAKTVDIAAPVQEFYVSANADRYAQAYDDAVRRQPHSMWASASLCRWKPSKARPASWPGAPWKWISAGFCFTSGLPAWR